MTKTPWAILLCKFNDNSTEPFGGGKTFYEEMFTSAGSGKQNLVDYFRDVSHGNVDSERNEGVWLVTLDKSRSDYKGSGANPTGHFASTSCAAVAVIHCGGFRQVRHDPVLQARQKAPIDSRPTKAPTAASLEPGGQGRLGGLPL